LFWFHCACFVTVQQAKRKKKKQHFLIEDGN